MFSNTLSYYKWHIVIFSLSFLVLTRFNIDPDLGWHLALGQRFWERGEIIRGDEFSWTMPGYEWANSYFVYQILIAFLFENFGHILTAVTFGILGCLAILVLLPKRVDFWKFLLVGLGAAVLSVNIGVRPHTFSFLFFAVLLVLVEKRFYKKWFHVVFWFIFFALWANFHRGLLAGLLVLALHLTVNFAASEKLRHKRRRVFFWNGLVIFAAFLGTLVNPFHIGFWRSGVALDLTSKENLLNIAEWQSVALHFPINLLFALSGAIFTFVFLKKFKYLEPAWFLTGAFLFALPILAVNFVFYWGAIFIFLMTRHFDWKVNLGKNLLINFPLIFSVVAVVLALILDFSVHWWESVDLGNRLRKDGYPVEAIEFLKKEKLKGGLFNEYGWGGFIDWRHPDLKVFIDGRMASWRDDNVNIFFDYLSIARGKCEVRDKYDIQVVLVTKDSTPFCFEGWDQVYNDEVAKILIKPID